MRWLLPFLLPFLALAQAPYRVEGEARYRGSYPLGSWEGRNPTSRGEVVWDGERASGRVCLEQRAWDSGNGERDKKALEILRAKEFPQACFYPQRARLEGGRFLLEGELEMAGLRRRVRVEGELLDQPSGYRFRGGFRTRFSDWNLERPRFLFLEVRDEVEVYLEAEVRR
ncbi:MAG: YceI family protein [Thermus sp.]|uniref:YceI family protein n=1 Tax=Thermus sp. TaxID=275 RepID=UPI0025E213DE|nr:YceI family protein [Thermus sp.]MCS6867186.1 YceI family protein [Thermus sp.]MCS7219481.1 YceI family protein [Thermus sp.]MDW8358218.1 YceI family protein [Thermus sp.]